MLIDLQLHSTYSDGYLTPSELAKFIAGQGIKIAALTDHNTISGINEFRKSCQKHKIKTIVGVELYVKLNSKRFNILWFNFDYTDPELHRVLRDSQMRRRGRVRNILGLLIKENKLKLNVDKVIDKYNHYVPINHIIDDILESPCNRRVICRKIGKKEPREYDIIKEIFRNPKYGILRESYININRIVKLRKKIGGQLILNHPAKYGYVKEDFLKKLKKLGFDGLEVLSPHHSIGAIMYLQQQAREFNLIETGGSDFHRFEEGRALIQSSAQYFRINHRYLRHIKKIIE